MSRNIIIRESELGLTLKKYQSAGELVPTSMTLQVLCGALKNGNYVSILFQKYSKLNAGSPLINGGRVPDARGARLVRGIGAYLH